MQGNIPDKSDEEKRTFLEVAFNSSLDSSVLNVSWETDDADIANDDHQLHTEMITTTNVTQPMCNLIAFNVSIAPLKLLPKKCSLVSCVSKS